MKSSSPSTPAISKEARYRVWWCLYTFEHMLGIMTGRATCIMDGVCTAPLPIPFEENQLQEPAAAEVLNDAVLRDERINNVMASTWVRHMPLNPANGKDATHHSRGRDTSWVKGVPVSYGLCYLYYCDLAVVTQEIVNKVYSVDCVVVPWAHIENRIGELRSRMDVWYSSLPASLDFSNQNDDGPDLLRCKLSLALHYYSGRITLGRPCLCRRDARQNGPDEKPSFGHEMAVVALESASRMLDLVPDEPNAIQLYQVCPWWCILHYLMQAATVLLLELSFGCVHMPEEEQNFFALSKKSIRWLHSMSEHSIASRRAWQLCDRGLRRLATGMNLDVSDMPSHTYRHTPQTTLADSPTGIGRPGPAEPSAPSGFWGPLLNEASVTGLQMPTTTIDQFTPSSYVDMPTSDLISSLTAEAQDSYFPYDLISGQFIRSFFPAQNEEGSWNQD